MSFLTSDGDNLCFMLDTFCSSPNFWINPDNNGRFPLGWSTCLSHLTQICPPVIDYLAQTQPQATSLTEHGGGYYYPDTFAKNRPNRAAVLAEHARRVGVQMNRTGLTVLSFICQKVESPQAMEAYEIYAREIDGLTGMIALQYYPYEGGHGKVFWVKNKQGVEIPVVTATNTIWAYARWATGGTPAKIARLVNAEAQKDAGGATFSLVALHAWSHFQKAPGSDETAELLPKKKDAADASETGINGFEPIEWCQERLTEKAKVMTPEELIWRLRMQHNSEQTKAAMERP